MCRLHAFSFEWNAHVRQNEAKTKIEFKTNNREDNISRLCLNNRPMPIQYLIVVVGGGVCWGGGGGEIASVYVQLYIYNMYWSKTLIFLREINNFDKIVCHAYELYFIINLSWYLYNLWQIVYNYTVINTNKIFYPTMNFLAHLSWKLKWAFLITCRPSVCPSVRLSVRPSVNFSHFHLLQNHWANFNQT